MRTVKFKVGKKYIDGDYSFSVVMDGKGYIDVMDCDNEHVRLHTRKNDGVEFVVKKNYGGIVKASQKVA